VKGVHAKAAWMRERAVTDTLNSRIVAGRTCWDKVVDRFKRG